MDHDTKTRKNVPNEHKMYQMVKKYPECLQNISNGHKIDHQFSIYDPPKFTQLGIFWSEKTIWQPFKSKKMQVIKIG
jgi:hypothetical protein